MSAIRQPATTSITIRLPAELAAQLDRLCALTERTRTYWLTRAVEEVISDELGEAQIIAEQFAAIEANPDEGISNDQLDDYLLAEGLTTREALDRAYARHGRAPR